MPEIAVQDAKESYQDKGEKEETDAQDNRKADAPVPVPQERQKSGENQEDSTGHGCFPTAVISFLQLIKVVREQKGQKQCQ